MNREATAALDKCYHRLAVWVRARGYAHIPPELVIAVDDLAQVLWRAAQLDALANGVPRRSSDDEITAVHSTGIVRG
jgi:hypothetical protein